MVLDTYDPDQDLFIFKNTYDDESGGQPKHFKIQRTHPNAPGKLYFVHIEVRDMDNLSSQEQREVDKKTAIKEIGKQFFPQEKSVETKKETSNQISGQYWIC